MVTVADDYTQDELITKVKAIDDEIERLILSTATGGPAQRTPLDYWIGEKKVNISGRVRLLQAQRKVYEKQLERVGGGVSEKVTAADYDMNDLGEQLGDEITGNE
jgi:hypothetical protein